MDSIKAVAIYILDIATKIFQINEEKNPQTIFEGKTFWIDGDNISVTRCGSKSPIFSSII